MSTDPQPRATSRRTLTAIACVASLAAAMLVAGAGDLVSRAYASTFNTTVATVDTPSLGCGSAEVTQTLATGSAWRMCARIDSIKGLVLEQIQFRPATGDREYQGWLPVVDSLYLAQLVVPYDSGVAAFNDVTAYGFGDNQLVAQTAQTCPGTTMPVEQSFLRGPDLIERTIPGICVDEVDTGLSWFSREDGGDSAEYAQQGHALEISSISKLSWDIYQQKVTLTDQGTITAGLGVTGDLAPSAPFFSDDPSTGWPSGPAGEDPAQYAASHWHNAIYRVDFGLGSGAQQVQQWDYAQPDPAQPARLEGTGTIQTEAFAAGDHPDPQTWWRVLNPTSLNADGHPQSYEISNDSIQDPGDPLTRPKVSFTNDHACQEYASDNLNPGCPGLSVLDYVAAETEPLTDPVAWISVGYHHVARDEDQSPMPMHWQAFSLIPRDVLTQQATTPIERSCVNGGPGGLTGSCAAVNLALPRITPGTSVVGLGTVLTSGDGTWRVARAPLTFQRQWLRDRAPIAGATASTYVVSAADLGHRISVRLSAEGAGIVPGSAMSAELPVPKATPVVTVSQLPNGQPSLKIRVTGKVGVVTGKVVVSGPRSWVRTLSLSNGAVTAAVPKSLTVERATLVVSYAGDSHYLPVKRSIRLARPAS